MVSTLSVVNDDLSGDVMFLMTEIAITIIAVREMMQQSAARTRARASALGPGVRATP
jgi:hypothetical protein